MTDWLDGCIADQPFLVQYRTRYAEYMQTWGPWYKAFSRILGDARIGISADEIAYTNIAKCWQDGTHPATLRLRNRVFPIATLLALIKPRAVLALAATSVLNRIRFDRDRDDVKNFSGPRFWVSSADVQGTIVWLSKRLASTSQ